MFTRAVSFIDICVLSGLYFISRQSPYKKIADTPADEDVNPFLCRDERENNGNLAETKILECNVMAPDDQTT